MKYSADIQRQSDIFHGPHGLSGFKVHFSIYVQDLKKRSEAKCGGLGSARLQSCSVLISCLIMKQLFNASDHGPGIVLG